MLACVKVLNSLLLLKRQIFFSLTNGSLVYIVSLLLYMKKLVYNSFTLWFPIIKACPLFVHKYIKIIIIFISGDLSVDTSESIVLASYSYSSTLILPYTSCVHSAGPVEGSHTCLSTSCVLVSPGWASVGVRCCHASSPIPQTLLISHFLQSAHFNRLAAATVLKIIVVVMDRPENLHCNNETVICWIILK